MLFDSSIRKELSRNFGATTIVLVTVLVTMTLIRVLGQASQGNFNPADVMLVMGYTVITFLPPIVSLALFISVVMTLTRLYGDSEMVIWFSSRVGLARLLGPLLRFAWPVLLAIALISLVAMPWAKDQLNQIQRQYSQRNDLERIQPGQFQASADGSRVFFVEKADTNELKANNVFIASNEGPNGEKKVVVAAKHGYTQLIDGDRWVVLERGQRLENSMDESDAAVATRAGLPSPAPAAAPPSSAEKKADDKKGVRIAEFETFRMLMQRNDPLSTRALLTSLGARPSLALILLPTKESLGELSMRLGYPLVALQLIIFALAYTRVNPRVSRTGNLFISLLMFQILQNLIQMGQNWIRHGAVGFAPFMVLAHGGLLAIALLWLHLRHRAWDWHALLPSHRKRMAEAEAKLMEGTV
jgi:lipopolysaccharide export system permease protein